MDKDIIIKVGKSDKKLSDIEGSAKEHGVILESAALALIDKIREQAVAHKASQDNTSDILVGVGGRLQAKDEFINQQTEEIKKLKAELKAWHRS